MLLSVLFILLVLSALMAAMVTLSGQSSRQLAYETLALRARLAAESALERKVFNLLENFSNIQDVDDTIAGCSATASTEVYGKEPETGIDQNRVIATGNCNSGGLTVIRNIEVEVIE